MIDFTLIGYVAGLAWGSDLKSAADRAVLQFKAHDLVLHSGQPDAKGAAWLHGYEQGRHHRTRAILRGNLFTGTPPEPKPRIPELPRPSPSMLEFQRMMDANLGQI